MAAGIASEMSVSTYTASRSEGL